MWLPKATASSAKLAESERVPFVRRRLIEREQGRKCEIPEGQPHQKKPARLLLRTLPQCDYGDGEARKSRGRIRQENVPPTINERNFQRMKTDPWLTPPRDVRCATVARRVPGSIAPAAHKTPEKLAALRGKNLGRRNSPKLWDECENTKQNDDGEQLKIHWLFAQEPRER